jgi:5,10-methylenetetrahydromethanopterin reductase
MAGRLGCYVLPGGVIDPRRGLDEARIAEALGFGTVWIGERYDTKDLAALAGAIGQVTEHVGIAAGVTHPGLRHPMVLASMGQTLQALTGERFALGLGRSASWRWKAYGVQAPTHASLADTAMILRRLWAGETVQYDGPAGCFPELRLAQRAAVAPPALLLAAVGPRTLALAGREFDGVVLHPFLTVDGVRESIEIVRRAATDAGRAEGSVRCHASVVVAPDRSPEDEGLSVGARAAGYLQTPGLGDAIVTANGWDMDALDRYRRDPVLVALGERSADKHLSRDQLVDLSRTLPAQWLPSSSVVGRAHACAARLHEYLDAGADTLVLHGTTSDHLAPLAAAFDAASP